MCPVEKIDSRVDLPQVIKYPGTTQQDTTVVVSTAFDFSHSKLWFKMNVLRFSGVAENPCQDSLRQRYFGAPSQWKRTRSTFLNLDSHSTYIRLRLSTSNPSFLQNLRCLPRKLSRRSSR